MNDDSTNIPRAEGEISVGLEEIQAAHERIKPHIVHTPVVRHPDLDALFGVPLHCKCEHQQAVRVFKSRGACNAVFSLAPAAAARGVVTHSSGNHAAALARAAQRRGIPAHVVMPENTRPQKVRNVREYGGKITFYRPGDDREAIAAAIARDTGAELIPPYDDDRIIAGQGTAALEFLEQVPDLDLIIAPLGGGGLLSGTLLAAKSLVPGIEVWAAEPLGADDAYHGWTAGQWQPSNDPQTIADGLLTSLGFRTFPIIMRWVDQILRVSDNVIQEALPLLWDRAGLEVEPSSAIALAALMEHRPDLRGRRVGIILSGGNCGREEWSCHTLMNDKHRET